MKTLDIQASYIACDIEREDVENVKGLHCNVGDFLVQTYNEKGQAVSAVMGRTALDSLIRKKLDRIMAVNIDMKTLREPSSDVV